MKEKLVNTQQYTVTKSTPKDAILMTMSLRVAFTVLTFAVAFVAATPATLIMPQNRSAFYADEPIEFAVSGLSDGEKAEVELAPQLTTTTGQASVSLEFSGAQGTVLQSLPAYSLTPATYKVMLNGSPQPFTVTVASGVAPSSFRLSDSLSLDRLAKTGSDFMVGNGFAFGILGSDGLPRRNLRGVRSQGMQQIENAIAANTPTLIYSYWCGFPTNTPFFYGTSWVDPSVQDAQRTLNFTVAQRLRRYHENIISIGTMGIPRLDAFGGSMRMFDDSEQYFLANGALYPDDPADHSDADWLKFVSVRSDEIPSDYRQASKDIKTVWPSAVFSTPNWNPQFISSGNDAMQQAPCDIPMNTYFGNWGHARLQVIGLNYISKAHNPTAKVSQAMGELENGTPPPGELMNIIIHRLALNSVLSSGLTNAYWITSRGLSDADLLAIDEPVLRLGPLFEQMTPTKHDIAILWSSTQMAMAERPFSTKAGYAPPKVSISSTADDGTTVTATIQPYPATIEDNYEDLIATAHDALNRAGYPSHIVHERILTPSLLGNYKVLFVLGQTFPLSTDVMSTIADFQKRGGQVLIDPTTTIEIPGALKVAVNIDLVPNQCWQLTGGTTDTRIKSYFPTTYALDNPARLSAAQMKAALKSTRASQVVNCASPFLGCERQFGGEGSITMLINAEDELPKPAPAKYDVYNYAPATFTYSIGGITPGSIAYMIEGTDWKTVTPFTNVTAQHTSHFEAGEMKIILVAPRAPAGIRLTAVASAGKIDVAASIPNLHMPWPITVTVNDPSDNELYRVTRSMDAAGTYHEAFPIGTNAPSGAYKVHVFSTVGGIGNGMVVPVVNEKAALALIPNAVRVFDESSIRTFLATKPSITVVYGAPELRSAATELADSLKAAGVPAKAASEADAMSKAKYPRVWRPRIAVYTPKTAVATRTATTNNGASTTTSAPAPDLDPIPADQIKQTVTLTCDANGNTVALSADGKNVGAAWRAPGTYATVAGDGWLDAEGGRFFNAGCHLFVDSRGNVNDHNDSYLPVPSNAENRAKYGRAWSSLVTYVGASYLPPELPEAYSATDNLILIGDSENGVLNAALQASELLPQVADNEYPGPGKALISYAWSPFAVDKNVIMIGAADDTGIAKGIDALTALARPKPK